MQKFGTSKMHLRPPSGLGFCPLQGGGSVVVDSLFNVAPHLGVLCMFFCFVMQYFVLFSSFAIILMGKGELVDLL